MVERTLHGCRILVAEDEYLLAEEVSGALARAGAVVLGPVADVGDALARIASESRIDAAVLDINLRGELVFPAADALTERGVPFVFATGYDQWAVPARFAAVARLEKPIDANRLTAITSLFPTSL